MKPAAALLLFSLFGGCAPESTPDLANVDQQLSLRGQVQHGGLTLAGSTGLSFDHAERTHRFNIELPAAAAVTLATLPDEGGAEVDTQLSLLRRQPSGALKLVAKNDDHAGSRFSSIERTLVAGSYLLEVRARRAARGSFVLATRCAGDGCPPPSCLFGQQFADLRSNERLRIESEVFITDVAQLDGTLAREQLVLAVQQSSHSDVTTAEQALARVDQAEVRVMELHDVEGAGSFTVLEYGAGDNSYGAIFLADTLELLASIHDGDLLACTLGDN